MIVPLSHFQF